MTFQIPKATNPPKIQTTSTTNWENGVVSAYDDGRTPLDGLRSGGNTMLTQDGTIRPRPSLQKFGPQPTGTVVGRTYPFKQVDGNTSTNWLINLQKVPQNEVQTITITGTPTGGTFTLTYSGQTTSSIAYNASASTVQGALEALSNIDVGDVACTGGNLPGTAVTVTFGGNLANTDASLITATKSFTGGTSPTITVTETTKGGDHVYSYAAKPSDTSWTKCTGANYDITGRGSFFQLNDKVIILNGVDSMSYLDITTLDTTPTITIFNALSDATAPTVANNGSTSLTTGTTSFTIWYAVTANSTVGETGGVATSQAINLPRSSWDATKNSLKITWTAVTGAQSYNLYAAVASDGSSTPQLQLLSSGLDASTTTFIDDGSLGLADFKTMPTGDNANSTAGPKASHGDSINGRAWVTGDKNNPYYVWHGGDPGHELDFTPANGGGFVQVGSGTREVPIVVWNFRSGQGDPQIKCLSEGLSGQGKRYTITSNTLSFASQSFTVWTPQEDYGYSGTDSPDGLIQYGNSTYYPSRDGFKVLGTKPQLQNLLSNDDVSQTILPDMAMIKVSAMDKCVGLGFEGRLYWALPINSDKNNQIWVLDLDRKGAWMKPWSIAADDMLLVEDSDGYTHHVVLSNNTFYELSYNTKTSDDGEAFVTSGATGLQYFSDDGREWVRLIRVVIEVLRPVGTVNFKLYGFTTAKEYVPLGTGTITTSTNTVGYGWNEVRYNRFGWNEFHKLPQSVAPVSQDVNIKVNKDVRYVGLSWSSVDKNVDYSISKLITEYVSIGIKNLS